jgi:cytolysin-activating lysine-acyltransferase
LQSGEINWLLDVIAPDRKATGQVIANFRQVVKEDDLRIHPQLAGLVDAEMRGKMMDARNVADRTT